MKLFRLKKKKKLVTVARTKGLSDRMGGTIDYRMATIGSVLKRSLDDRGGEPLLTLDPAFQGLPDTAHGGAVLAAFDAPAGIRGAPAGGGGVRGPPAPTRPPPRATGTRCRSRARASRAARRTPSVCASGSRSTTGPCGAPGRRARRSASPTARSRPPR